MTNEERARQDVVANLEAGMSREALSQSINQMIKHLEVALTERTGRSLEDTKLRLELERLMLSMLQ